MVNVISSPITNAPAPTFLASVLWGQNRIHHFDKETGEDLMKVFDLAPGASRKRFNEVTLPARNYCTITECAGSTKRSEAGNGHAREGTGEPGPAKHARGHSESSKEVPAVLLEPFTLEGCIHAEIDPNDKEGKTCAYQFSIPPLKIPPES